MKLAITLVLFLVVVLGPLYPVLPIPNEVLYPITTIIVFLFTIVAAASDRVFRGIYLPVLICFVCVICGLPLLIKGEPRFILELLTSGLLGYLAYRYLKFPSGLITCIFSACVIFIGYYWLYGSLENIFYSSAGDKGGVSRNYVMIVLFQWYLAYYVLCLRSDKIPTHLPIFIFPFIGIISGGVGNTAASFVMLIGYLVISYRVSFANIVKTIMFFMILLLFSGFVQDLYSKTELASRISEGWVGIDRIVLMTHFIDQLDSTSIIVGFNEKVTFSPFLFEYYGEHATTNVHNSYFNLYRDAGIFSIFYFTALFYTAYNMVKVNKILALIFIGTLVKAFTDGYYFVAFPIDFILFYLFLMTPAGMKLVGSPGSGKIPHKVDNGFGNENKKKELSAAKIF